MMTNTLFLVVALASQPSAALTVAREMTEQPLAVGKGDSHSWAELLYAHAFAAYALVDDALDGNVRDAEALPVLDALIAATAQQRLGRNFNCGWSTLAGHTISRSVAHRGHLLLMLMARARVAPLTAHQQQLADALASDLSVDIEAAPNHLLPTYAQRTWAADNEVALAALRLHGSPVAELMHASLRTLEDGGLPASELVPGTLRKKDVPRGCALSWSVAMRAQHAPEEARSLYARYRATYWVKLGPVVGFREWPPHVDRPSDFDSGPIVFGIGVAASGIGLAAARLVNENDDVEQLTRSAGLAGLGLVERQQGAWMMRATAAWARNARRFDGVRARPH